MAIRRRNWWDYCLLLILSQTDKIVHRNIQLENIRLLRSCRNTRKRSDDDDRSDVQHYLPPVFCISQLADEDALCRLYHRATQLMALMVMPVAAFLAFFSIEVLHLWTGNYDIAIHAGPIATVLVIGSALNALNIYLTHFKSLMDGPALG